MDNKLDEAVEVAVRTFRSDMSIDESGCVCPHTKMRAAILTALPVILGDPIGYAQPDGLAELSEDRCSATMFGTYSERHGRTVALYAPSLGEGDGR